MRIKRLEITGFKSFKDPVVLHFDHDISGIVGPNGCGKSNVVDAIRWAMGEQSAKHLRGSAMEDVIFAGSESYGPLGMAEVILTFENEGDAPAAYAEYAEISVGRRLFRSGESDYFINKTPCRLMDITDFFLGTGVGTKAYSIIEQGRVGQIVSSKPGDRRQIIEEAAGVTKYKYKKRAAMRKMEATEQNLTRVRDILGEIRRRLGSLERQAKKAARYKRLRAEMFELDLWAASHRHLELVAQARLAQRDALSTEERLTEAQERLASEEAQVTELREILATREREIFDFERQVQEVANLHKLHESHLEHLGKEGETIRQRRQESAEEVERLDEHVAGLERELEDLALSAQDCQEEQGALALDLEARERARAALAAEREQAEASLESARAQVAQLRARQERTRAELSALDRRRADLSLREAKARSEREDLLRQLQAIERSLASSREALSEVRQLKLAIEEQRESAQQELQQLRERAVELEAMQIGLRTDLGDKRSRQRSLQEIEERLEGYDDGVRAVMHHQAQAPEAGVLGLVADVLTVPANLEPAVEAALGDRLQSVIVQHHDASVGAIDYLKTESQGRSSFIPLSLRPIGHGDQPEPEREGVVGQLRQLVTIAPQYEAIADYLLGDVTVVEDLSAALRLWSENGHRARLVTLDGDILDPWGVVTGGSRQGAGWGLLQQKREIKELADAIAELTREYADVEGELHLVQQRAAALQAQVDSMRQDAHSQDLSIVHGQKDVDRAEADLRRIGERLQVLGREEQELEETDLALNAEQEQARTLAEEDAASVAELEAQLPAQVEAAAAARQRVEAAQQEVMELRVRAASLAEKGEAIGRAAERNQLVHADELARQEKLRAAIEAGREEEERLDAKAEEARAEMNRLREEATTLDARLAEMRQGFEAERGGLFEREAGLKGHRDGVSSLRDSLHGARQRGSEASLALEHLATRINDKHGEDLRFHLVDYHDRPSPTEEDMARLGVLREKLEGMGEVNVAAIEEFDELRSRNEYLTAQEKDLAAALDSLRKAITRINRTSRARFQETFDAVNQKFQQVFPRLFRGGRAHLQLTEAEDLLEAGVEIVAQPPGKKLSNINLLSGGEKALTAVALIFSIFLVKPSPFCLLDEVDAPLDDANIGQFNSIVRDMARHSQFIIITHNNRTMQVPGRLYGVTMQEPGVSKLVSVELRQQQDAA